MALLRTGGALAQEAREALRALGALVSCRDHLKLAVILYCDDGSSGPDYSVDPALTLGSGVEIRPLPQGDGLIEIALAAPTRVPPELIRVRVVPDEGAAWERFLVLRSLGREQIARCRVEVADLTQENEYQVLHLSPVDLTGDDLPDLQADLHAALQADLAAWDAWRAWAAAAVPEAPPLLSSWLEETAAGKL